MSAKRVLDWLALHARSEQYRAQPIAFHICAPAELGRERNARGQHAPNGPAHPFPRPAR